MPQQRCRQQQGEADGFGPLEAEKLLEADARQGGKQRPDGQDPQRLIPEGGEHFGGAGLQQQGPPTDATAEPEQLQGAVQGTEINVNPAQGQAQGCGHRQHPEPCPGAIGLPPLQHPCGQAEAGDQQGDSIKTHLLAIGSGDRVGAVNTFKGWICAGHPDAAVLFTSVLRSGPAGTMPPGLRGNRAPK